MGTIVVSENVTLDGVMEDPTGEEGLDAGGWFGRVADADRAAFAEVLSAEAGAAEALLLGARTYAWFVARWADRPGAWADRLRALPKYVVTSRPELSGWGETTVLGEPVEKAVAALKEQVDGDIVVYASGRLVHALLEHDLVDELRLIVYPVLLGAGRRLFAGTGPSRPLQRAGARPLGEGLLLVTYRVVRGNG